MGRYREEHDIGTGAKLYKLLKIRMKLIACAIFEKLRFQDILRIEQMREPININTPQTFDDKLWYMKKHFYSSLVVKCADKAKVRDYVKECGLEDILVPVYGIYNTLDEVHFEELPDECYIKCNHSSGYNYLYRKNKTDEKWLRKLFTLFQKYNFYAIKREWSYKDVVPQIVLEKRLQNKNGQPLLDYRLFCFEGKLKLVMVNNGTVTNEGEHANRVERSFYSPDFEWIPEITILGDKESSKSMEKPQGWEKMVDVAQILSKPFAFCRVDLYNVDSKVYLSEMTFFPNSGVNMFQPREWALKMGKWLDLEKCKDNPIYTFIENN